VRSLVLAVLIAAPLSACSGALPKLSATDAAQSNYNNALAEYQACFNANKSKAAACEKERLMLEASTNVLATTIASQ
jgi:hypothetical protein